MLSTNPQNQTLIYLLHTSVTLLGIISKERKQCILMGDFNLDLIKIDKHNQTKDFIHSLYTKAFYPTISKPTRVTEHSATLLDNIITNITGYSLADPGGHVPPPGSFELLFGFVSYSFRPGAIVTRGNCNKTDISRVTQSRATSGPRARSGPRRPSVRPATQLGNNIAIRPAKPQPIKCRFHERNYVA